MRLTETAMNIGSAKTDVAFKEFDKLVYSLGTGAARIWARLLLKAIPARGFEVELSRRRLSVRLRGTCMLPSG